MQCTSALRRSCGKQRVTCNYLPVQNTLHSRWIRGTICGVDFAVYLQHCVLAATWPALFIGTLVLFLIYYVTYLCMYVCILSLCLRSMADDGLHKTFGRLLFKCPLLCCDVSLFYLFIARFSCRVISALYFSANCNRHIQEAFNRSYSANIWNIFWHRC